MVPHEAESRVVEAAAQWHAAAARLVADATQLDESLVWQLDEVQSCAHWLVIHAGVDLRTAREVLRVGHALKQLPLLKDAFQQGRVSFDKISCVVGLATPLDEPDWLNVCLTASGSQLTRICREARRLLSAEDEAAQRRARGLWTRWDSSGMLRLSALLPPEEGGILRAALEKAVRPRPDDSEEAEDPAAAADAGALVAICEQALTSDEDLQNPKEHTARVLVHVDAGVLSDLFPEGRSHLAGGSRLSAETSRRLTCDGELTQVKDHGQLPIDLGRSRRIVSKPLRRALHVRDRVCRFPGCGVPATKTSAHHITHWAHGGPTDLSNLVSLCGFHHRRVHAGAFTIHSEPRGEPEFQRRDGTRLGNEVLGPSSPPTYEVGSPEPTENCWRYPIKAAAGALLDDSPLHPHNSHFVFLTQLPVLAGDPPIRRVVRHGGPSDLVVSEILGPAAEAGSAR